MKYRTKLTRKELNTWTAALRSGDYEQGTSRLCCDGKFCCLGVAYDVLHDGYWHDDTWDGSSLATDAGETACWGVELDIPSIKMAVLNDSRGLTFAQIADWIDENLASKGERLK